MPAFAPKPMLPQLSFRVLTLRLLGACLTASLFALPAPVHAGSWSVAVGASSGSAYRPIAYAPPFAGSYWPGWGGWGSAWNVGFSNAWGYGPSPWAYPYAFSVPTPVYVQPVITEPIVLAAQAQPPVRYFCASSNQYFPIVDACAEGWNVQAAAP